jgi:hypothetical protein
MTQVTTEQEPIVQILAKVPKSLKKRLLRYKHFMSDKTDTRVRTTDVVSEALDKFLKKFGY